MCSEDRPGASRCQARAVNERRTPGEAGGKGRSPAATAHESEAGGRCSGEPRYLFRL